jgi:hypothetical protein
MAEVVSTRRRWPWWLAIGGLLVVTCGVLVVAALPMDSCACDCAEGVVLDGRAYSYEPEQDGRVSRAALGPVLGRAEEAGGCGADLAVLPVVNDGADLYEVPGFDPSSMVAAVVDGDVLLFRSWSPDESASTAAVLDLAGAVAIDVSVAGHAATIDRPGELARVVGAIAEGAPADVPPSGDGPTELVATLTLRRADGVTTETSAHLSSGVLVGVGRTVGLSPDAIGELREIVDAFPPARESDGLALTTSLGTAAVHPAGTCRIDRPDGDAAPGDTVQVTGDRASSISFLFASGGGFEPVGASGSGFDGSIRLSDDRSDTLADGATVTPVVIVELASSSAQFCSALRIVG